jgi:endoglucanase
MPGKEQEKSVSPERRERIVAAVAELCQIPAPSGHEGQLREHLRGAWSGLGLNPQTDRIGNLLAKVGGTGRRVLLQAHMDEIGYVVRHIDANGFLFLDSAQGGQRDKPERRFMIGQPAIVLRREEEIAEGIITGPSGHVVPESIAQTPLTLNDLFVDIGVGSREEVEATGIHVGSPVLWSSKTRTLGNRIVSKALDDRIGLAAIIMTLEALREVELGCELWVGATVQEENGLHGALAMAASEPFDAVLALDNTLSGDIPAVAPTEVDTVIGAGPAVIHQDGYFAYDQKLAWDVIAAGRSAGIAVQHAVYTNAATDAGPFFDAGSPSVCLGPPVRYTHTPNEMVDIGDLSDLVDLLVAFATERTGK